MSTVQQQPIGKDTLLYGLVVGSVPFKPLAMFSKAAAIP